eukprot:10558983-Lingulodinium_polyedra.AAC.1
MDVQSLSTIPDLESFGDEWRGDVRRLYLDEEVRDRFMAIDVDQLAAAFWSAAWAPSDLKEEMQVDEEEVDSEDGEFACDIIMPGGERCGRAFKTKHGLLSHQMHD